jgi:hypothetical protein
MIRLVSTFRTLLRLKSIILTLFLAIPGATSATVKASTAFQNTHKIFSIASTSNDALQGQQSKIANTTHSNNYKSIILAQTVDFDSAESSYTEIEAALGKYFPPLVQPTLLDLAERSIQFNTLEIVVLQGILELNSLVMPCIGPSNPQTRGHMACLDAAASLAVTTQVLVQDEACPVNLVIAERMECLFNLYAELASRDDIVPIPSDFSVHHKDWWQIWNGLGKPDPAQWTAFPELRRYAEEDAVLLHMLFVRYMSLREQSLLIKRIFDEAVVNMWGQTVSQENISHMRMISLQAVKMWREITKNEYEDIWTCGNPSGLGGCDADDASIQPLGRWLMASRTGTVPASTLSLPQIQKPIIVMGPLPSPPQTNSSVPQATPSAPNVTSSHSTVISPDYKQPVIWVQNGAPIFIPKLNSPPSTTQSTTAQPVRIYYSPPTAAPKDVPEEVSYLLSQQSAIKPKQTSCTDTSKLWEGTANKAAWKAMRGIANNVSPYRDSTAVAKTVTAAKTIYSGVGKLLDAVDVYDAVKSNDAACTYINLIKLIGGLPGAYAMELTGFDDKLVRLQNAGINIPAFMSNAADNAARILNPFSLGQPTPYSQYFVGSGNWETASPSEQRNYFILLRQAMEDARKYGN